MNKQASKQTNKLPSSSARVYFLRMTPLHDLPLSAYVFALLRDFTFLLDVISQTGTLGLEPGWQSDFNRRERGRAQFTNWYCCYHGVQIQTLFCFTCVDRALNHHATPRHSTMHQS